MLNIVTIAYNDFENLKKTIDSVSTFVGKSSIKVRHIIIDGASTDGTLQYLSSLNYPWLNWYSEVDDGISDAFNKGVSKVVDGWVLILNSGDFISNEFEGFIGECLKVSDIIFFPVLIKSKKSEKLKKPNVSLLYKKVSVFHCGMMVHKKNYDIVGMYNKKYKIAMDYEWIRRAMNLKIKMVVANGMDIPLSIMNTDGVSNAQIFKAKKEVFRIQKMHNGFSVALIEYTRSCCFGVLRLIYERLFKDSYIR